MSSRLHTLSAITVARIKEPGMYADGGGLYLRVKASGGKSWAFRYMLAGKAREMGLGAFPDVSLADAREKAAECRRLKTGGTDPVDARKAVQDEKRVAAAKAKTFKECAVAYIEAHKGSWRNEKHAWQWGNTLERFVYPIFGNVPVNEVDVALVMKALEQKNKAFGKGATLWTALPETAARVRGRIEVILDWATARGFRRGENPARWRGHLENLLPKRSKKQVRHQPALPYDQVGAFVDALSVEDGTAARALEFTILTVARTSETIGATWPEIDLKSKIWTVPPEKIKGGREHRVPLSEAAVQVLKRIKKMQDDLRAPGDAPSPWVFDGQKKDRPLSNTAMLMLLRRMKRQDITVHGFRSTFRDWAAEQTNFSREVAEMSLAHVTGDKVEQAYQRGDLLEKRRQLMGAWARYCATRAAKGNAGGKVVKLGSRA